MENKKFLDEQNNETKFEEMEPVEEYGNGRDFIEGAAAGVTIVAGVAGVIALT